MVTCSKTNIIFQEPDKANNHGDSASNLSDFNKTLVDHPINEEEQDGIPE